MTKNAKIIKKNYLNIKGFFHEGGQKPTFLLVILTDIL